MFLASSSLRLRWLSISVGAATFAVMIFAFFHGALALWNTGLQDWMLRVTAKKLPGDFVLVGIDERSLRLDGLDPEEIAQSRALQLMKSGFPWSREVYARLITRLLEAGAKLVVLDLVFPAPREGDDALAAALKKYKGKVVLGCNFDVSKVSGTSTSNFYPLTAVLAEAAGENVGFVNFSPWRTDVVARIFLPYGTGTSIQGMRADPSDQPLPSMMTVAARLLGKETPVDVRPRRFRYSAPYEDPIIPLYEIFLARTWELNLKDGQFFKDKVVLLGATSEQQKDFLVTPFGRMGGPEVHLHALAALLRDEWISQAGPMAMRLSIPLAGLAVLALAVRRRNVFWFLTVLVAGVMVWLGLCGAVFLWASYFLPITPPLTAWLVSGFAALASDVALERRERGRLRSTLERYVSRDVVHEIVENPDSYLQTLEGQRKDVVILFSDLKGFTADSERLDPSELVAMLNEYFGEMVEAVFLHDGTIDKFMGDALMATWGCIQSQGSRTDAQSAVRTALEMKERLRGINARREAGVAPWGSGIGICQGSVIFGNIGSQQKMEPTVIGDTVNLASRFEGLTRMYGCGILINEMLADNVREICEVLLVDVVRVKGRQKPEKLYSAHPEKDPAWVEAFRAARELYTAGKFEEAGRAFEKLAEGGLAPELAQSYRRRCELLRQEPPEDWTGIWNFQEK